MTPSFQDLHRRRQHTRARFGGWRWRACGCGAEVREQGKGAFLGGQLWERKTSGMCSRTHTHTHTHAKKEADPTFLDMSCSSGPSGRAQNAQVRHSTWRVHHPKSMLISGFRGRKMCYIGRSAEWKRTNHRKTKPSPQIQSIHLHSTITPHQKASTLPPWTVGRRSFCPARDLDRMLLGQTLKHHRWNPIELVQGIGWTHLG